MDESSKSISGLPDLSKITTYQSGIIQSTAYRQLKQQTDEHLREHGITTAQWFVIGIIYDAGKSGIRITDLAKKTGTTLSFLTHTVNLLESKNILARVDDIKDSRAKMVSVAPIYWPKVQLIEEDLRNKMRGSLYSKISPDELKVYIKVLYMLAAQS